MTAANTQAQNNDRQDYGAFFRDGLLDIFTGLGLIIAGAFMFTDMVYLVGVYPATIIPAWQAARKKTLARMGGGEMPAIYQARSRAVIMGVMIALFGVATLGLFAFANFGPISELFEWLSLYYAIVLGAIIALLFSIFAFALAVPRCHLYAALTLALFVGAHFIGIALPFVFIILGGMITVIGTGVLVRFLGEHPED
jgi:hypothetical protein